MKKSIKKIVLVAMLFSVVSIAFADRGGKRKANKSKVSLNITTPGSLRSSLAFNFGSGLSYKGSFLTSQQTIGSSIMNTSIVTFEKGNTIYIIPYKQSIIMPDIRPGYSGIKIQFH
jgi:hypothetical protein